MFLGNFQHNIDKKGRVFIPSKFREELGENFIISQGIGKCLFVFSQESWLEFAGKLKNVPITNKEAQHIARLLFASACECIPDKQGRILIPQRLRDFAEMADEVVANGAMTRVELWSKKCWDEYLDEARSGYEEALEKLAEFGI